MEEPQDLGDQPPSFTLVPLNSQARRATENARNQYFQVQLEDGTWGLWLSFEHAEKQTFTLGRTSCDIYLPEGKSKGHASDISPYQASFHVAESTGAVILTDHSSLKNTELLSRENTVTLPFRDHHRSVIVCRGINTCIAFGRDRWYQFQIRWTSDGLYGFSNKEFPYRTGPRKSRVKKYIEGEKVGGGAYGIVFWVIDTATGGRMAVKKFHNLSDKNLEFATREVKNLFKVNESNAEQHKHILEIFDYAGGRPGDEWGEIFMPLMVGNLKTLVEGASIDEGEISNKVLRQMLHALDCMVSHKLIHRDIKPENILWEFTESQDYHFRLGDFGLSNEVMVAKTVAGTEPFMAPEVFNRQRQGFKVDIWSLFATVVWVRNTGGFRDICGKMHVPDIHNMLVAISGSEGYEDIKAMGSRNPSKRPSARMLLRTFNGESTSELMAEELTADFETMDFDDDGLGDNDRPYYEPYAGGTVPDSFAWELDGQGSMTIKNKGKGKSQYIPPTEDDYPREQAFVKPLNPAYQYDDDEDDTIVRSQWNTRPFRTTKEHSEVYNKGNGKGKRKP
ncbi:kinase-like protein [Thozetella sp. PMI_491]|nr:kinase-like protein [Thozetella sp. PMI_491]